MLTNAHLVDGCVEKADPDVKEKFGFPLTDSTDFIMFRSLTFVRCQVPT